MADIFISYSSQDREQATMLTELLTSAGLSVWIDQQGIGAATSWSREIVDGINQCKALILLLSSSSITSHNVIKEVSLASEKRKKIVPLDLEPVTIPPELEYQLAGLQRTSMTNIDAIIRALGKIGLEATQSPTIKLVKETDGRKSLMILPFEDLSPTGDNGWFADGIVSELISSLSHIKSLRLMDQQETKGFKNFKGHLTAYAREMQVRYFVQGSVRKFGDQIKVTTQLLDIDTGDYLWQDSHKGVMDDIFEIQEAVASKVVEGLKLHLTNEEKKKLSEHGTENADAYELYMKASDYFERRTKEEFRLAIQLLTEAIQLDPKFAKAYDLKAYSLAELHRAYDRNPALLTEAESLSLEALRLRPNMPQAFFSLSNIYLQLGKLTEAEEAARECIRREPENYLSHFGLGFFYENIGQPAKAIAPYEEAVRLKPDHRNTLFNLIVNCSAAKETGKCREWAFKAIPIEERYLRLHPNNENSRIQYAILLSFAGRSDEARREATQLTNAKDSVALFNTACLLIELGEPLVALTTFHKAVGAGFKYIRTLKEFLTHEGITSLRDTSEYEEVKKMVEEIEREAEAKKSEETKNG